MTTPTIHPLTPPGWTDLPSKWELWKWRVQAWWSDWRSGRSGQRRLIQKEKWPYALAKAVDDPFDYACGLRNGLILFFSEARPDAPGWVHLSDVRGTSTALLITPTTETHRYCDDPINFDRGLEVRLSDIVWVADAPFGS